MKIEPGPLRIQINAGIVAERKYHPIVGDGLLRRTDAAILHAAALFLMQFDSDGEGIRLTADIGAPGSRASWDLRPSSCSRNARVARHRPCSTSRTAVCFHRPILQTIPFAMSVSLLEGWHLERRQLVDKRDLCENVSVKISVTEVLGSCSRNPPAPGIG